MSEAEAAAAAPEGADQATEQAGPSEPQSPTATTPGGSPGKGAFGLVLTLNRIKTFIKEDAEVKSISTEACFAVARATELFLEATAERAAQPMLEEKREELGYNDVANTVASWPALDFLIDIVPKKVPAALVLDKMKK